MAHGRLLIGFGILASTLVNAQQVQVYPRHFLWGAAMSAHQVEGLTGGGQNADWYPFEHTPGNIRDGTTADVATDHWHRYERDFRLAAHVVGVNTIRTSIAWEKMEPAPGVFDEEVLEHYRNELEDMHRLGLRPMVTLLHGTTPLWFQSRGGWTADDSPQQFAAYAEYTVSKLRHLCDLWITINEPMVLIGQGYLQGTIPPQIASPVSTIQAAWNMARAHRLATARIHEIQPLRRTNAPGTPLRGVGLVNSSDLYAPFDPSNPADLGVTAQVIELSNWAFPKLAIYGTFEFPDLLAPLLPGGQGPTIDTPLDDPSEKGSPVLDWFGVNYYTLWLVRSNGDAPPDFVAPDGPKTDLGRLIYPQGTEQILRDTAGQFPGIPLAMTENGVADKLDAFRPDFIRNSLHYLDQAVFGHDGLPPVDVRGYYEWSLTDDFEWQNGLAIRYGLIQIQYDRNLHREPRPSASVYRQEIQARRPARSRDDTDR